MAGPRLLPTSGPPWDDNPAAFLRGLEATAEGCRWLLERWTELGNLLKREVIWTLTDLYKSIRLQGKHPVEAVNDPGLNLQILAWEVLGPGAAVDFWVRCYNMTPREDPGFQGFMEWREIVDKPGSWDEAVATVAAVIAGQVERLEELAALHEEIGEAEASELVDAASFDPGPVGERLRRHQGTKTREMRQTLELFLKLQAAGEKRKKLTTGGTEGTEDRRGRRDAGGANEANPGCRPGWDRAGHGTAGRDGIDGTTDGTESTDGMEESSGEEVATIGIPEREEEGREEKRCANEADLGRRGEGNIHGRVRRERVVIRQAGLAAAGTLRNMVGGDELTEEDKVQLIRDLVGKRLRELLEIRAANERSQSPGGAGPMPEGGDGEVRPP